MDSQKCDKAITSIPYVVFESCQARNERHIKRLTIIIIILIVMLFISNAIWIWLFSGYELETYEVESDSNSSAYYNDVSIGGDMKGDLNNGGTNKGQKDDQTDGSERQN